MLLSLHSPSNERQHFSLLQGPLNLPI